MSLRLVFIAGSLACLTVLAASLLPFRSMNSQAFAQVQESVHRVKTVRYLFQVTYPASPDAEEGRGEGDELDMPVLTREQIQQKIAELQQQLASETLPPNQQAEIEVIVRALRSFTMDGSPALAMIGWTRISGKDRERIEVVLSSEPSIPVKVFNGRLGRHVGFDPANKQAFVVRTFQVVKGEKSERLADMSVDFFRDILTVPADATHQLPEKQIGDRKAIGFRRVRGGPESEFTETWWVDPETMLPIRIERQSRGTNKDHVHMDMVMSQLVYDAPMDESLFDVKIPEGYTVIETHNTFSAGPSQ